MAPADPTEPCRLLSLPLELRHEIFSYLLPHSVSTDSQLTSTLKSTPFSSADSNKPRLHRAGSLTSLLGQFKAAPVKCTVWRRGSTSILAVSRQMHEEAANLLYGNNVFSLAVAYDGILLHFAWQLPSGLQPRQSFELVQFSESNIQRMKRFSVTIKFVDSYTSTVKYNCGVAGLAAGLKGQVEKLVRILRPTDGMNSAPLKRVQVVLSAETRRRHFDARGQEDAEGPDKETLARVMEPFGRLRVQQATVTGAIGEDLARLLEDRMMNGAGNVTKKPQGRAIGVGTVDDERKSRWAFLKEPISPAGYYSMPAARLTGFNEI